MYKTQLITILILGLAVGSIYADTTRTLQAIVKKPSCNLSTNGRCGASYANTVCPTKQYCSKWNWCGATSQYKSTQQAKFSNGGACKALAAKPAAKCNLSKNGRCGPSYGNTVCLSGTYCSKWNWCGAQALYKSTQQKKFSNGGACKTSKTATKKPVKITKKVKVSVKKPIVKKVKVTKKVKVSVKKPIVKKVKVTKKVKVSVKKPIVKKVTKVAAPKKMVMAKKVKMVGGKGSLPPMKLPKLKAPKAKKMMAKSVKLGGNRSSLPPMKKVLKKKVTVKINLKKKIGGDLKKFKTVLKKGGKDAKAWFLKVSKKLQIKGKKATSKAKALFKGIQKKLNTSAKKTKSWWGGIVKSFKFGIKKIAIKAKKRGSWWSRMQTKIKSTVKKGDKLAKKAVKTVKVAVKKVASKKL